MIGYMYIIECSDGTYYTGSTNNLEYRFYQHETGEGPNYTRKRLPVKLVYYELFDRIDLAFYREKQVQGWSRKKKEALIKQQHETLPELSRNHARRFDEFNDRKGPDPESIDGPVPEPVEGPS